MSQRHIPRSFLTLAEIIEIMKTILTTIFLLYASIVFSQTQLDSLSKVRSEQIKSKELIEKQVKDAEKLIEETEKKIIADILNNGYSLTLKSAYKGETFDLREKSGIKIILSLKDGDTVNVIGADGIFLIVEYADTIGKLYLSKNDVPMTILTDYKYRDYIETFKTPQKGSASSPVGSKTNPTYHHPQTPKSQSSTCSSTQCSGTTQKKTRCKNMTTNCNGRCHLH